MPDPADRILTSHAGSLPRPEELVELNHRRAAGELTGEEGYQQELTRRRGRRRRAASSEAGIDVVNDGEYGHAMGQRYDYGSWWTYVFQRLGGLELVDARACWQRADGPAPSPARSRWRSFSDRRDWKLFSEAYADPRSGAALPEPARAGRPPRCAAGPITYRGQERDRSATSPTSRRRSTPPGSTTAS